VIGGMSAKEERYPSSRKNLIEGFSPFFGQQKPNSSADAVAQCRLHCWTGLQGTKHVNGSDGFAREFWRDVRRDHSQPKDLDVKRLAGRLHGLQVLPAVLTQTEVELVPGHGLLDDVVVTIELVSDCCPDEVGAVGVKTLLHQKVDMAEIDIAEIDRDLFTISRFRPKLLYLASHSYHPFTIHADGMWRPQPAFAREARSGI
jgi:hypothetical protein